MRPLTMGSLFDGSGGFPLAFSLVGVKPRWASEIEPYPIKVTTRRFPNMKHLGDISKINGADLEPVDVITGGSPCQDMSVAGKRVGLDGERSGLFREQIRIIKEMREATNGKYPRFMFWENVPGALSSNRGADFRCVLEETIGIKTASFDVPMPEKDKWGGAGLILDEDRQLSVGWRILDAQYWGVPQRRRRIFLIADFGGTSATEILFKREGLSRNFTQSRDQRERITGVAETCIDETGGHIGVDGFNGTLTGDVSATLGTNCGLPTGRNGVMAFHLTQDPITSEEISPCVTQGNPNKGQAVVGVAVPIYSIDREAMNSGYAFDRAPGIDESGTAYTLKATGPGGVAHPIAIENHPNDSRVKVDETGKCQALTSRMGTGGGNVPLVAEPVAYGIGSYASNAMKSNNPHSGIYEADTSRTLDLNGGNPACNQGGIAIVEPKAYGLQGNMIGRQDHNGPQGKGVNEEVSFTLNATDHHAVCYQKTIGTLQATDYKGAKNQWLDEGKFIVEEIDHSIKYIVRRLTPLECCRLQGFPDYWVDGIARTEEELTEEELAFWRDVFETHRQVVATSTKPKTDNQIKKWLQETGNDSAEYKMWGNGVALPCVLYFAEGMAEVLRRDSDEQ